LALILKGFITSKNAAKHIRIAALGSRGDDHES